MNTNMAMLLQRMRSRLYRLLRRRERAHGGSAPVEEAFVGMRQFLNEREELSAEALMVLTVLNSALDHQTRGHSESVRRIGTDERPEVT